VGWCDARAYCEWAGKRLCGQVGGGAVDLADAADAAKDEWFNACSFQGTKAYPYGNTYEPETCNGYDFGSLTSYYFPSNIMPACEGGFPGLFQMSGNVAEWTDACNGSSGEDDLCLARGADGTSGGSFMGCGNTDGLIERGNAARGAGIRCCAGALSTDF
jgi:formylglycine-generating enzyme required for sulfatase activity